MNFGSVLESWVFHMCLCCSCKVNGWMVQDLFMFIEIVECFEWCFGIYPKSWIFDCLSTRKSSRFCKEERKIISGGINSNCMYRNPFWILCTFIWLGMGLKKRLTTNRNISISHFPSRLRENSQVFSYTYESLCLSAYEPLHFYLCINCFGNYLLPQSNKIENHIKRLNL